MIASEGVNQPPLLELPVSTADVAPLVDRLRRQRSDDEQIEVKACATGLGVSIWDSVSSFANTSGGVILLGLDEPDFGPVTGFSLDLVLDQFVSGIGDGGTPGRLTRPPSYALSRLEVDGAPVLRIDVAENAVGHKPCFVTAKGLQGGAYKRVDDKDIRLSPTEIFELQNALSPSDADREIVTEADLDDLDEPVTRQFLERKAHSKALRGTTTEAERLARVGVTDKDGQVRLGGLLTLGVYPQQFFPRLYVDVAVHPSTEKSLPSEVVRFVDRVRCEGSLSEMVDEAVAAVLRNLRTYAIVEGTRRREHPEIPAEVLREAVANAVVHREYHMLFRGEPVSVDVYSDRVEISNPGGLWGGKTIDNMDDGTSRCRNQTLMQLLGEVSGADSGFSVEGQGGGVKLMIHEMEARALDRPVFRAAPDRVTVVLRRHGAEVPAERAWLRRLAGRDLSPHEDSALLIAKRAGKVGVSALHDALRIDSDEVRGVLRQLVSDGLLAAIGGEEYALVVAETSLRPSEIAVWKVLSVNEPMTVHQLAARVGKTPNALRPVLRALVEAGWIEATAPPQSQHRRYLRRDPLTPRRASE